MISPTHDVGRMRPPPVFLVGMPRSGTKLLRGMLGSHPSIRFLDVETDFCPYWVNNWHRLMPTGSPRDLAIFIDNWMTKPFFVQMSLRGQTVARDDWTRRCRSVTPADVFEALMRSCLEIPEGDLSTMWGDKSPSYIRHIPLLAREYPGCRVIHIVRDVRDYCLSMQRAWRKSVLRAAQRWTDDVGKARKDGARLGVNYFEVRYEELLKTPAKILESLCEFLGLSFDPRTLSPGRVVENIGDASSTSAVLEDNYEKYVRLMPPRLLDKVEHISCQLLGELGYRCNYRGEPSRVPAWKMTVLLAHDAAGVIASESSRVGLVRALRHNIASFFISGNRS
jgi:hypothetical protein